MTLPGRKVYLFVDEFTRYQEPELALKLKSLLESLGYQVLVPKTVESGRAAISKGCVKLARKFAEENVRLLGDIVSEDVPLVGVEPSCILSFRDEYPDLVPEELRGKAVGLDGAREGAAGALAGGSTGEKPVFVAAPGTSCRQQILDGTGVHAVHPIEILLRWLAA